MRGNRAVVVRIHRDHAWLEHLEPRTLLSTSPAANPSLSTPAPSNAAIELPLINLAAPTGFTASAGTFSTMIHLAWSAVAGATSYQVFHNTTNDFSSAILIVNNWTRTHYNDTAITPDVTYFYWITALANSQSSPLNGPASGYAGLPGPDLLQATNGTLSNEIQVTWNPVANASSYDIFASTTNDINAATELSGGIISTSYNHFPIDGRPIYYYWVRAEGSLGPGQFTGSAAGYAGTFSAALHVHNTQLVNALGQTVRLTGVNLPSLEYSYGGDHILQSEQIAVSIWHANLIRLQMSEDFWFGYNYSSHSVDGGASYRSLVDQVVNFAAQNGAYVMLDLQWSDMGVWGSNIGLHDMPDAHSTQFWQSVASHYSNNPAVIFDPFNEPHGVDNPTWKSGGSITENNTSYPSPGMQGLINTIRNTGANNVISPEANNVATDLGALTSGFALNDGKKNLIYQVHIYPGSGQDSSAWNSIVSPAASTYPILIGEWGVTVTPAQGAQFSNFVADTWVQNLLNWANQNNYNWSAWSFNPQTQPVLISDFNYTPTSYFGSYVQDYLVEGLSPAAPTGVSITSNNQPISLSWNAPSGAASYQVFRNTSNNVGTAQKLTGGSPATTYLDTATTAGQTYFYWIRGRNPSGIGAYFLPVSNAAAPTAPAAIEATGGTQSGNVQLTWTPAMGAASYQVWRGVVNDIGQATKIAAGILSTLYNDTTAISGQTYFYWIRARNLVGAGLFSNPTTGFD
ncbi:MAG: cellulase family glycosylhydrolase [Planctomycetota bacterium]|nr:cellulase family glycosylhydrolase [Planctomycetota bacterium]